MAGDSGFRVFLEVDEEELRGSVLVTGFRGFGMVGYLVSKYLALLLEAEKVGYILTRHTPPMILVEEDGTGFPFDIYFVREPVKTVIVVNRALPEREHMDEYVEGLARWASRIGVRFAVLTGGLSRDYRPEDEKYGYRHVANRFYEGPALDAPRMEEGLGVMGPLALLFVYMDYYRVPAVIVLPYSAVEEIDYSAAAVGVKLVAEKMLGVMVDVSQLEEKAARHREMLESLLSMMMGEQEQASEDRREGSGMYM